MIRNKILIFIFLLGLFGVYCDAGVFSKMQMGEISCSATKAQLFYYYLAPNRDPDLAKYKMKCNGRELNIFMPKWFDKSSKAMLAKKVWRDPEEGEITEAAMWQTSVSIIYEFLNLSKKTFPAEFGGAGIQPALLIKEYADIRIRFQMSLDRLYRARLFDSMNGRGRNIIPSFNLILREMESIADAVSSNNISQYSNSVTAIAVLSQDSFSLLFRGPRKWTAIQSETLAKKVVYFALTILGMILIFVSVRLFFSMNEKKTEEVVSDYAKKAVKWKADFARQFLTINVNYLVGVPIALLALMGLLTFSFLGFIILTAIGIYLGLQMPTIVLNAMKAKRGKAVDNQLMDALILLANSLRSGLDIVQGFDMVAKDLMPPISDEFGLVIKNYQLGMSFEKALEVMEERVNSKMLSYMIRAIILQRQMGGNLTKVFERIVVDIREESKLEDKTKALTAQQKIQSIVVGIMPWIMFAVMFMFQPDTMMKFYGQPLGMFTLLFCIVWVGIGMKVVSKLGDIQV
ncbi:MAG: type II secretion system F family protein [Elusimicrobiota bacterium]|nr:type II secretion system F family protein [Elusimicrobiota bacterium]